MKTKILSMGIIKKGDFVLMRKKPEGSKPYKETWYLFGSEPKETETPQESFIDWAKENLGIKIQHTKTLGQDSEVKEDHDGETKKFIYLDSEYKYLEGKAKVPFGAEKVEWISTKDLKDYDIVLPSVVLFKKMGYIK